MNNNTSSLVRAAVVALVLTGTAGAAHAQMQARSGDGPWLVRLRAVHIDTAGKSDAIAALGVPADAIGVSDKTIPEIDISYFFTRNIAAELILTYPQKHTVSLNGVGDIGSFKHLPPTLTVQYHFMPDSAFKPYVGAGVNYTRISSVNLNVPGVGALDMSRNSWGGALQAGFDYRLTRNWYLNLDVKKLWIDADVKVGGNKVTNVKVDPVLVGVGLGYRF